VELNQDISIARGFAPLSDNTQWVSAMVKPRLGVFCGYDKTKIPLLKFETDREMW